MWLDSMQALSSHCKAKVQLGCALRDVTFHRCDLASLYHVVSHMSPMQRQEMHKENQCVQCHSFAKVLEQTPQFRLLGRFTEVAPCRAEQACTALVQAATKETPKAQHSTARYACFLLIPPSHSPQQSPPFS